MNKRNVLHSISRSLVAVAAVGFLLAGCSTTVAPKVVSVAISPTAPTVAVGATTKLTATVTVTGSAAKTVTWSSADTSVAKVDQNGVVTGVKAGSAKVTATSTADKTKSATVTVTVTATKPVVNSFGASPGSVVEGNPSTLSWDVSGASSYTLSDGTKTITIPQTPTGSIAVLPAATTTYTLTATNSLGDTTATATVTVTTASVAPTINSFTASSASVSPGSSVTLSWDVSGGVTFGLSDGTNNITIPQTNSGTVDVTPTAASTTYTLTATNSQGSATAPQVITFKAPTITNLTATVAMGSTVDLSWSATDATSFDVFSTDGASSTQPIQSGVTGTTLNIPIPDSTHQTIRVVANGAGGTAQADVALTNVVTSSQDYDPYDLQGFIPETPIPGTLRDVMANAPVGAIIGFASDVTSIDLKGVDTIALPGRGTIDAHLIFNRDVTISGPASGITLTGVSAAPAGSTPAQAFTWESRMGFVTPGTNVTLDHLTIQGGTFVYDGAGFRNEGNLTLSNSTVTGNRAWYEGGAVLNAGGATLNLVDSHIDGNQAVTLDSELGATFDIRGGYTITVTDGGYGGGIYNRPGATVTSTNTTFDGNASKFSGGAIYDEGGTLTMTTSPVSNNTASYLSYSHGSSAFSYGGGIYTAGSLTYSNADFSGNTSADLGGGFAIASAGTATLDTVNFDGNTANYGGAIEHYYCTDPSNLTLTGVNFGTTTPNVGLTGDPDINLYDTCASSVTTTSVQSQHPSAKPPYTEQDMIKNP